MSIIRQGFESADLDVPVVLPTLNLDFANSQSLDKRITFSRGSIGTRVNRNGLIETIPANLPRFDFDPVTGECRGLLIEESRQNLLTYSDDFSLWSVSNGSVQSNVITAPDGNTTADKLVENSASGNKEVSRSSITFTSGTSLTFSCFVKAEERNLFRFGFTTGFFASGTSAYFNLSNGTVSLIQGGITSASIIPYPNGWYRCVATVLPTSSGSGNVHITLVRSGTQPNYVGDGTSGIYLWGAQLEEGAFPTSYIPTEASTRTRAADNARITGKNFSEWYRPDEGTIYSKQTFNGTLPNENYGSVWAINNYPNDIVMTYNPNNFAGFFVRNNYVVQVSSSPTVNVKVPFKNIVTVKTKDFVQISNVFSPQTNTSGVLPNVVGPFVIGGSVSNGIKGSQTISRLTYYPVRLSNSQLQTLTK